MKPVKAEPVTDNVTAFRRLPPKPKTAQTGRSAPRKMPVALIFIALCVLFVGIKLYWP